MSKYKVYLLLLLILPLPFVLLQGEEVIDKYLYTYKAKIVKVYDADTITANIDLGFNTWIHGEKLRLARINAPEMRGAEKKQGKISRDWLRKKILGETIIIETIKRKDGIEKKGKYGRYIVEIYFDGINLNDELVRLGLAKYQNY